MAEKIDALLFDLGGVVIHNDLDRVFKCWASHAGCDITRIRDRISFNGQHDRYERGEIESEHFFEHLRTMLDVSLTDEQFLEGWNSIFVEEMPGISDLLHTVGAKVPLYAFTNTNRAHELCWSVRFSDVLSHFQKIFVSSTIGLRKPDAEAFDYVAKEIGVPTSQIMFFDDLQENIDGAHSHGLKAVRVSKTQDIIAAIGNLL